MADIGEPGVKSAQTVSPDGRLSVCYLVPGHNLLTSAGPTRNVLNLAQAMSQWADVTVAFRKILEPVPAAGFQIVELDPDGDAVGGAIVDDAAVRGVSFGQFLRYLRTLDRFLVERAGSFDVVMEKAWLLSGYLTAKSTALGVPGVPIENLVPVLKAPWQDYRGMMTYAKHLTAQYLMGHYLRKAPAIIAETDYLKSSMVRRWRLDPTRIEVVTLGVDDRFLAEHDGTAGRVRLGIDPGATVMLYVGVLDRAHDIGPALQAFVADPPANVELHIVGDGPLAAEYRSIVPEGSHRIVFHGRVPYADVPEFIAAADLCLAPYSPSAFPGGEVAYSTLKIPEYMAVGRPVVSVPSGRIRDLIDDGKSGYLFDNEVAQWVRFLADMPSRSRLREMGVAARIRKKQTWSDTAAGYLEVCRNVSRSRAGKPRGQ